MTSANISIFKPDFYTVLGRPYFIIFTAFFLFIVSAVVAINEGVFLYTMDDPYIHLALVENMLRGHYGVNLEEASSASSSVLWPYLLSLIAILGGIRAEGMLEYLPLVINFLCCAMTIHYIALFIDRWVVALKARSLTILLFVVMCTNLIGLVFVGMEHSLQVLISTLTFYYAFEIEKGVRLNRWLLVLLVVGPLVRYENALLSAAVGLYAIHKGHFKAVLVSGAICILLLLSFSFYLHSLGLPFLPSSVLAKSGASESYPVIDTLLQVINNLLRPGAQTFLLLIGILVRSLKSHPHPLTKPLILAAILHFFVGKFAAMGRYEIYLYLPLLLLVMFLYQDRINQFMGNVKKHPFKIAVLLVFFLPYSVFAFLTPLSANNIYEQQYQMKRFTTEYYKKPVGINDLGLVSYKNDSYVLDLWGLANIDSYYKRRAAKNSDWMEEMTERYDVGLAMIYKKWFVKVPDDWQLVAEMELSKPSLIVMKTLQFYATGADSVDDIKVSLRNFSKTIPPNVKLTIY